LLTCSVHWLTIYLMMLNQMDKLTKIIIPQTQLL
jgi:hypothetical protein